VSLAEASLRILLSLSTTKIKRSGDNGYPYLIPLLGLKKGEAAPLISTIKETDLMQPIMHITN